MSEEEIRARFKKTRKNLAEAAFLSEEANESDDHGNKDEVRSELAEEDTREAALESNRLVMEEWAITRERE
jgi:hypothetical protein